MPRVHIGAMTGLGARGLPPASVLRRLGTSVEKLGYDSLWVGDAILRPGPVLDSVSVLATFATQTQHIQVGANVFLAPLRHPIALARIVNTLDYLSDGRFVCGVGVGGSYPAEFDALGVPLHKRGRLANETLEILLKLWREPKVTFDGEFFHLHDVSIAPAPVQRPHPPLWVGGTSTAALRRAARFGQGWLAYLLTPVELAEATQHLRDLAAVDGRADKIAIVASLFAYCGETHEAAVQAAARALSQTFEGGAPDTHRRIVGPPEDTVTRFAVIGTADECAATIARFIEAGATHVILNPLAPGIEVEDQLNRLAKVVLPRLPDRHALGGGRDADR
jgi:probable F420-dependent oxidoreductase